MLPPLQRMQLDNGVVLEGGLLCTSHIPSQIRPVFQHNTQLPLFKLPTEVREQIYSYLPLDHARIKLTADHAGKRPLSLRARPYTLNFYGALKRYGTHFDFALQQTCRQLYADTSTRALRTSILFINSAENHAAVALHMTLHTARAWAVRSIEIPYNPVPWWNSYDAPFFTRIFPALRRIYVYVASLGWTWNGLKVGEWYNPKVRAFLRTLRRVEGEEVDIRVMARARWQVPTEAVERWMLEGDESVEVVRTRKDWTRQEMDSWWWMFEARLFARERVAREATVAAVSGSS